MSYTFDACACVWCSLVWLYKLWSFLCLFGRLSSESHPLFCCTLFNCGTIADYRKHMTIENDQSDLTIMIAPKSADYQATNYGWSCTVHHSQTPCTVSDSTYACDRFAVIEVMIGPFHVSLRVSADFDWFHRCANRSVTKKPKNKWQMLKSTY